MATPSNKAQSEVDWQSRAALTADAILGEFRFRPHTGSGDAIPLLYKFIDYITILLGGKCHVSLTFHAKPGCVSSDLTCHLGSPPSGIKIQRSICGQTQLQLLINDKPQHLSTVNETEYFGEQIDKLLTILHSADFQTPPSNSKGETAINYVDRLAQALGQITKDAKPPQRDAEFLLPDADTIHDASVREIIGQTAFHLEQSLRGVRVPAEIGFRFYLHGKWHLMLLGYDDSKPRWKQFPQEWLSSAKCSFLTGFAQLEQLANDHSVLCIPCHFGGIPWLVVCYECHGDGFQKEKVAYGIYRDLASRVNTSIRILGQYSYAKELGRLFSDCVKGNFAHPAVIRDKLTTTWRQLGSVYPVRSPTFTKGTAVIANEEPKPIIHFPDGTWLLDDSEEANPFLVTTPPLSQERGESWSSSLKDLERDFIIPKTEELTEEHIERKREIAEASYAVGHALSHRLGELEGGINALSVRVKDKWGTDLEALNAAKSVRKSVRVCRRVATLMNFVAAIRNADEKALLEKQFLTSTSYVVSRGFSERFITWVGGAEKVVSIPPADLAALQHQMVEIASFTTPWGQYRPFDVLYEELFFELLFNAAKFSERVHIEFEATAPSIILSNDFGKDRLPNGAGVGKWEDCRAWRAGGLRFLADCLNFSGSGAIEAQVEERESHYTFHAKLRLSGLRSNERSNPNERQVG